MSVEDVIARLQGMGGFFFRRPVKGINLTAVQLRHTEATDDDIAALACLREEIDHMGLEGTKVTSEGLVYLLAFPRLKVVDMTDMPLTDSGLSILGRLPSLQILVIEGTLTSREAVEEFSRVHPHCEVCW